MAVLLEVDLQAEIEAALEMWVQFRQERPQDVIPTLEVTLARARSHGDALLTGRVLVALGQGSAVRGDGARALQYADEAIELLEPHLPESNRYLTAAYRVIGRVQYDYGNDEHALEVFEKALAISDVPSERVALQGNIASIQTELGQLEPAIQIYQQLIPVAEALHDHQEVHQLRSNLALALDRLARQQKTTHPELAQETREAAMQQAELSLQGARRDGSKNIQSHVLRTIASMLLEDGKSDLAWDALEQSLVLAKETGSDWNEIHTLHSLAKIALDLHDHARALELAQQSLEQAEQHGFQEHAAQAHKRLADIYETIGEYKQALDHERQYFRLDREVKSQAASKRAEALAAQMQLERARLEAKVERERAETLARLNQQLEQQALTDGLTGVANRRALNLELERLHAHALRTNQVLSVVLFDLDHFKQINDRFTHAIGDAVLRRMGTLLLEQCRKGDFVARYGGEEFALLLVGADGQVAFEVCERLRLRIEQEQWNAIHKGLHVTASFGYCDQVYFEHHEKMLALADQALYQAKEAGRNRVYPVSF